MSNKTVDVIGLADPIQDMVMHISRLPGPNVHMQMEDVCFQGGGNVSTAMVACARLGLKSSLYGKIGDDMFGKMIVSDLAYNGVDTAHIVTQEGRRSNFCLCISEHDIGSKEFISKGGELDPFSPEGLDEAFIRSAKVLHVGNGEYTPALGRACDIMHESGGIVSVDACYYKPIFYEHYDLYDVFIASEHYFDAMCEKEGIKVESREDMIAFLRAIQKKGPNTVIFTFGADGCKGVQGDTYFEAPSFRVDAIDTTGAGDVFHGAFIYCYLRGWDAETSCRFCSAVSAIKCTRIGGRSGIPTVQTVERFLEDGVIEGEELDRRVDMYRRGIL